MSVAAMSAIRSCALPHTKRNRHDPKCLLEWMMTFSKEEKMKYGAAVN
jgi:hypothetical protein